MILDGKKLRDELLTNLKDRIKKYDLQIKLAIIEVGEDEASKIYIRNKERYCALVGIKTVKYQLPEDAAEEKLISLIASLNADKSITGIILQSPIPSHLDFDKLSNLIDSHKDVDGFTKDNVYNLYLNRETILPCTVKGIIKLLEHYKIDVAGKDIAIVGRGNIVGKPLSLALANKKATVSMLHSATKDLAMYTKNADIVIAACGSPHIIKENMIKDKAVVIDVGVSRVDGKITGDVDYESVINKASFITPNPGGVGPMTVAMIIDNLVEMKEREDKNNG